jgi:hypothetical protein
VLVELSPEQVLNSVPQICGEDPCAAPQASADRFAGILAGQLGQNVTTPLSLFQTGAFPWICLRTKFVPDGLPTTPISWEPSPAMAWWPLASMACGFMRIAGLQPVSYRSENDGHAFVNLTVRPDDPNDRAGVAKSRGQLRGHTDAVAFPFAHEFELGERDRFAGAGRARTGRPSEPGTSANEGGIYQQCHRAVVSHRTGGTAQPRFLDQGPGVLPTSPKRNR